MIYLALKYLRPCFSRWACLLVLFLLLPLNGEAAGATRQKKEEVPPPQPPRLELFAFQTQLVPVDSATRSAPLQEGMIYVAELPAEIELKLLQAGGRDLCVFNAKGEPVPFDLQVSRKDRHKEMHTINTLYPLWGKSKSLPEEYQVSFTIDKNAHLVPIVNDMGKEPPSAENRHLRGYVLTLPEKGASIDRLLFEWDKDQSDTVQFSVQTGDDLRSWRILESSASLVRLDASEGALETSAVRLKGQMAGQYLRLLFEPDMQPLQIRSITVEQNREQQVLRSYGPLEGMVVSARESTKQTPGRAGGIEYYLAGKPDVAAGLLVDSISLGEVKPGQFAKVGVYTGTDADGRWRYVGEHAFFATLRDGALLVSDPLVLNGRKVTRIRLEETDAAGALPPPLPLVVQYIPRQLFMLAQGEGPYTLAFGSTTVDGRSDAGLQSLLAKGGDSAAVRFGDIAEADGYVKTVDPEGEASGTTRYLLWAVLGLGVGLLGYMAVQLAGSMRKEGKE